MNISNTDSITNSGAGTTFTGTGGVNVYRATVIASALRLYAKTGMKANRAYTPTAMLAAANEITGHHYRRGQYEAAAAGLTEWARRTAAEIHSAGAA